MHKVGRRKARPEDCHKNTIKRRCKDSPQKAAWWISEALGSRAAQNPTGCSRTNCARSAKGPRKSIYLPATNGQRVFSCAAARLSRWGCGSAIRVLLWNSNVATFELGLRKFTSCTTFVLKCWDFQAGLRNCTLRTTFKMNSLTGGIWDLFSLKKASLP